MAYINDVTNHSSGVSALWPNSVSRNSDDLSNEKCWSVIGVWSIYFNILFLKAFSRHQRCYKQLWTSNPACQVISMKTRISKCTGESKHTKLLMRVSHAFKKVITLEHKCLMACELDVGTTSTIRAQWRVFYVSPLMHSAPLRRGSHTEARCSSPQCEDKEKENICHLPELTTTSV